MKINIRDIVEADEKRVADSDTIDEAFGKLKINHEPESVPESAIIQEPEPEHEPEFAPKPGFFKKHGWILCIAFVLFLMAAWTFVATNMIPREVNATINGTAYTVQTKAYTIGEFLEEQDINYCKEDYINKPVSTIVYDGIHFELTHATKITVRADGTVRKYKTLSRTVKYALEDCNVKLGSKDIVEPGPNETLNDNMFIVIKRVTTGKKTVEENIPFKTITKDDISLDEGKNKIVSEGKVGRAKVTYEVTYVDGKAHSKKEISRTIITQATDRVIAKGTRINYNGITYSRKLTVRAYSYTGGGTTAMGTRARVGEIAVDPRVIPLGTNVYIEGIGARRAEDTGGNIKGNTIDIYMNTQRECINWGVRYVTIYVK